MTMAPSHRPTAVAAAALAFVMLAALLSEAQMEPAPAPGPADCMMVLLGAADCLSYVEAGSNETVPEKLCCGEMRSLVTNRPDCLCQMLAKSNSLGIKIDTKKALKLPSICHVTTPPISMCSLFGVPVAVPAGAPSPTSGSEATSSLSPGATASGGIASAPEPTGGATTNGHLCGLASLVGAAMALLPFVFAF